MKSIIAFALLAIVSVNAVAPLEHATFAARMQGHIDVVQNMLQGRFLPQAESAACQEAQAAIMGDMEFLPCVSMMTSILPMMSMGAVNATVLVGYCTSGCPAKAVAGIGRVMAACADGASASDLNQINQFSIVAELPCIQVNGEFCFPKMMNAMATFSGACDSSAPQQPAQPAPMEPSSPQQVPASASSGGSMSGGSSFCNITTQMMMDVCSPCTRAITTRIGQFIPESRFDMFDLVCMKDGNKWCYTEIQAVQDALEAADAMPTTTDAQKAAAATAFANAWARQCGTQCMAMYSAAMINEMRAQLVRDAADGTAPDPAIMQDIEQSAKGIASMCVKDAAGAYCYPKFMANPAGPAFDQNCPDNKTADATCPQACKDAITQMVTSVGCCAAEMIPTSENPAGLKAWLMGPCGVAQSSLNLCPRPSRKAAGRLALANLRIDWVRANRDKFDPAFKADVATPVGASPDDVTIIDVTSAGTVTAAKGVRVFATTSGIYVTFQIAAANDDQVNALQTALNANINSNSIALNAVGSLPSDAKVNAANAIAVDSSKSTSTTCSTDAECADATSPDAAFGVAPTAIVAALVAMLVAALRQ